MTGATAARSRIELRRITIRDLPFLVWSGLDRERAGVQYTESEYWQQLKIAPMRYFRRETRERSFVVLVDRRRAGYIGFNPYSGNIEYYLQPWARGGTGKAVIVEFLRRSLPLPDEKSAFMVGSNVRSQAVFRNALASLGLTEPDDYEEYDLGGYTGFTLRVGAVPRSGDGGVA